MLDPCEEIFSIYKINKSNLAFMNCYENVFNPKTWGGGEGGGGCQFDPPVVFRKMYLLKYNKNRSFSGY